MLDYHDHHLQLNVVTHIYTGCWLIRHLFELKFDCNPWEIENRMRLCSYIKYIFGYISKILFYVYLQEKHLSFHSITNAFTLAIRNTNKKQYMYVFEIDMSMKTEADKMITDERKWQWRMHFTVWGTFEILSARYILRFLMQYKMSAWKMTIFGCSLCCVLKWFKFYSDNFRFPYLYNEENIYDKFS